MQAGDPLQPRGVAIAPRDMRMGVNDGKARPLAQVLLRGEHALWLEIAERDSGGGASGAESEDEQAWLARAAPKAE